MLKAFSHNMFSEVYFPMLHGYCISATSHHDQHGKVSCDIKRVSVRVVKTPMASLSGHLLAFIMGNFILATSCRDGTNPLNALLDDRQLLSPLLKGWVALFCIFIENAEVAQW